MVKTKEVRLLYFEGCPHADAARANVRAALARTGRPERWEETDLTGADCPASWQGFPSPTVLVGGADVTSGDRSRSGSASCRPNGAPTVAEIVKKLQDLCRPDEPRF
jgi:hypothetical protein